MARSTSETGSGISSSFICMRVEPLWPVLVRAIIPYGRFRPLLPCAALASTTELFSGASRGEVRRDARVARLHERVIEVGRAKGRRVDTRTSMTKGRVTGREWDAAQLLGGRSSSAESTSEVSYDRRSHARTVPSAASLSAAKSA